MSVGVAVEAGTVMVRVPSVTATVVVATTAAGTVVQARLALQSEMWAE
jgi:hypothetical protein